MTRLAGGPPPTDEEVRKQLQLGQKPDSSGKAEASASSAEQKQQKQKQQPLTDGSSTAAAETAAAAAAAPPAAESEQQQQALPDLGSSSAVAEAAAASASAAAASAAAAQQQAEEDFADAMEYFEEVGVIEALTNLHEVLDELDHVAEEQRDNAAAAAAAAASDLAGGPDMYEKFDIGEIDWRLFKAPRLHVSEKAAFVLGSTQLWASAYWLGAAPHTFHLLYAMQAVVLMAIRFFVYKAKKWHYFLFDFCYWANLLLALHLALLPTSRVLSTVTFAFDTGPLLWSTFTFRNSLVYHDLDKVTSLFMHLVPACVSWALRWHPAPPAAAVKAILATNLPTNDSSGYGCEAAASGSGLAGGLGRFRGLVLDPLTSIIMASPAEAAAAGLQLPPSAAGTTATAAVAEGAAASRIHAEGGGHGGGGGAVLLLRDFILLPLAFYAAWAALYYFKIFVWSADRIRRLGYHTLFSHITAQRQGVFYEIARRVPQRLHAPAYLLFHLTYCLVTFLIAAACWRNYVLHSLLLVTMVSVSIWHGANFYFTVFLRKHQQQLVAAAAAAAAATTVSSPAAPDVQNRQLLRQ